MQTKHHSILLLGIFTLLLSMSSFGQQETFKSLKVTGNTLVKRSITQYRAKITLNLDQAYYSNPECQTIADLKAIYFEKLKAQGFDISGLVENEMEASYYGYLKGGTSFTYETADKEELALLSKVRMNGVTTTYFFKYEITDQQQDQYRKEAFKDAVKNAEKLAKIASVEIGDIISISEFKVQKYIWSTYDMGHEEYASVQLGFLIK